MSDTSNSGILSQGDVLNNTYVISSLIASGGTGEVYRAMNRVSGREIAIKTLKREFAQNEQFIELMKREASVLHEVIDPAVVRYYDVLETDLHGGFLFLVMEFINGHSLAAEMKAKGPLDANVLMRVAERVLQGLKAAHDKKAFHRDLSPDNIILREGDPDQATLIDFGIAKDVNEGAKTVVGGGFAGKYQYASPEQMEGRADARSDLYSLGMTLLGAYRGQAPLQGSSMMEIVKAKAEKPDISDITGSLQELVSRLVEPEAVNRLQTADDALAFLRATYKSAPATPVPDETVVAPRPAAPTHSADAVMTPAKKPAKKKSGGMAWVIILLLLLGGGAAGAWWTGILDQFIVADDPNGDNPTTDPSQPTDTVVTTPDTNTTEPDTPPDDPNTDDTAPNVAITDDTGAGDTPSTPSSPTDSTDGTTSAGVDTSSPEAPSSKDAATAELPLAIPFRLSIERTAVGEPVRMIGNLPSADLLPNLQRDLQVGLDSFAVLADITPARGEPFEGWTARIAGLAMLFAKFDSFTVAAEANDVVLLAEAANEAEKTALLAAAWQVIEGSGLNLVDRIAVAPPSLTIETLSAGLQPFETCGPVQLSGGTNGGIGDNDTISVKGYVAAEGDQTRIVGYINQNAPGRPVEADMSVVNAGVCNVIAALPTVQGGDISIEYGYGTKDGTVSNDTFRMGENPVIDVVLPADKKGYVQVAFADLAEQVFHLLPHQARVAHNLEEVGTVKDGQRHVRVAFPIKDASIERLGFKVVEPLGINVVVAIVSEQPVFGNLRPRAESNGAYLDALAQQKATLNAPGTQVIWRFLKTEP
ncbi:MAG: protein kinase [Pseudomonadota bacterium]